MGSPTVGEQLVASCGSSCGCTDCGYKNNKSPTSPYILISYGRYGGRKDRAWVKDMRQVQRNPCILVAFSESCNNISLALCIPATEAGTRCSHALHSSLIAHNLPREKSRSSHSRDKTTAALL